MSTRLLITNAFLRGRTGSELYCEEVAHGLKSRGYEVGLFAPVLGELADQLRQDGFVVVSDLAVLPWKPEVIHAQHFRPSNAVALAFPDVPMLVLCHGAVPQEERPTLAPNVRQYAAVDHACRERIVTETGVPRESVHLLLNGVNLDRFLPRKALPEGPARALVFSNYAREDSFVRHLRAVCESEGVTLDTIGSSAGRSSQEPWNLLPEYDLVFAKGRCAMEAMACGCAVVLCDEQGLGPMVTARNFAGLRQLNFGFLTLTCPHDATAMRRRIRRYDASDAAEVSSMFRAEGDFDKTLDWLAATYRRIATENVCTDRQAFLRFASGLAQDGGGASHAPSHQPPASLPESEEPLERRSHELLRAHRHLIGKIRGGSSATDVSGKQMRALLKSASHDLAKRAPWLRPTDLALLSEALGETLPAPTLPAPMAFIVGAPRSGTTRLRLMLDAHPLMAVPPETGFIPAVAHLPASAPELRALFWKTVVEFPLGQTHWKDYSLDAGEFRRALDLIEPFTIADGVRCFYRLYATRFNKPRFGDKTPMHVGLMTLIQEMIPEARFIHIIRDGRDSIASLRHQPFAPSRDMARLAGYWARQIESGRAQSGALHHYLEVKFEDLLRDPRPVLQQVCAFLDLSFDEAMCRHHETSAARLAEHDEITSPDGRVWTTKAERLQSQHRSVAKPDFSRIGCWRSEFTEEERRTFDAVAGQLLEDLGYES